MGESSLPEPRGPGESCLKTVIRNTTTEVYPANPDPGVYAVTAEYGGTSVVGRETVLEGFTLQASGGVLVYSPDSTDTSALTIRRNAILGDYAVSRVGIQLLNSGGDIRDNVIRLGDPEGADDNFGLYIVSYYYPPTPIDAVVRVEGNRIEPGRNKWNTGIWVGTQAEVGIYNNLILMSVPKDSIPGRITYGIDLSDKASGSKQIVNNTFILSIQGTMSLAGVRLNGYDDSLKAELVNNIFHFPNAGGLVAYETGVARGDVADFRGNVVSYEAPPASQVINHNADLGAETYLSPAQMDAWPDIPADKRGGTSDTAPVFLDLAGGDLRISGPPAVSQGGIPWSGITGDILGNPRTAPWSIGAYEQD